MEKTYFGKIGFKKSLKNVINKLKLSDLCMHHVNVSNDMPGITDNHVKICLLILVNLQYLDMLHVKI